MRLLNSYLTKLYLKYFFIVLISLEIFFVGIDFMQNLKSLNESANIKILYMFYNFMYALNFTLPISIILALIITAIVLIKSNELVALYSSGYSKKNILKPIFLTSLSITFLYIGLNFTEFAYAKESISSIKRGEYLKDSKTDLFLKYNNSYIYFGKLFPVEKKALDVQIFVTKDNDVERIIKAKEAKFYQNRWRVENATVIEKPKDIIPESKIVIKENQSFDILDGFKPKIIDNVYEAKASFSILDAIDAILLLQKQNISIEKIKSILLSVTVFPLFSSLMVVILFFFIPISSRFFNMLLFSSIAIFISLATWGFLFSLVKLSISGVILAEIAIVLPIALLSMVASLLYFRNR